MLVDMHLHESTCSSDSKMTLEEIIATARERGLDAVCITDHDSMGLKETAEQYSRETGFPIFVGVEYFSLWGDITAFGIDRFPDKRIPAQDFVDQVNAAGGFCVASLAPTICIFLALQMESAFRLASISVLPFKTSTP